jgi:8-oxo-dGTP pyrophosphatase MutT (NUDIX family)
MEARTAQSRVLAFAQKAFITKNGKLLVIRRAASDPVNPLRWEVPGGRIEPGELLDDCIRREVREEVGLEIVPGCRPWSGGVALVLLGPGKSCPVRRSLGEKHVDSPPPSMLIGESMPGKDSLSVATYKTFFDWDSRLKWGW